MNLKRLFTRRKAVLPYKTFGRPTEAERAHAELQRDIALAGITPEHPLWQAVLSLVDEHAAGETEAALRPNLTSEQRHYTAGAAATADYLSQMLRDAQRLATQRLAKQKQG